jgi:hypothetical protein
LLITVLQLFDLARELTQLALELIQANQDIGGVLGRSRKSRSRTEGSERDSAKKMLHGVLPDTCRI